MSTTRFHVQGMSCQGCAKSAERKLLSTPGVQAATVDLASTQAEVTYDEKVTQPGALKAAVESLGFKAVD